jgi:hypothetical protein
MKKGKNGPELVGAVGEVADLSKSMVLLCQH